MPALLEMDLEELVLWLEEAVAYARASSPPPEA